ncbi:MAG: CARDB domain-containing protein, partial [Phycisphaerae bacterium]
MKGIVFSGALSACLAIGFCAAVCEASGATDLELRDAKTGNAGGLQATRSVKVDTKQRRALLKPATGNRVTAASRARDRASQPKSSASLDGLRATRTSGDLKGPGGCGPECDNCWIGTAFEDNCNPAWEGDGQCDCGCQFADGDDCGAPDLIIQSSGRSPSTGMTPGESIYIEHTVLNQGTGDADDPFWATWYLSTDLNVTIDDYAIAFHDIASLESGASVAASSNPQDPVLWPDVAPYNTPGAIYYVAVMADDLDEIVEGDETNNWGAVWPVVLAGGDTTCPGTGGCCQENETSGCDDASCCETVCTVNASCCDLVWTQTCADLAEDLCTVLCSGDPGCPGEGDCCGPNGTTGCDDASCCNIVCAADPFCCNTEWDVTCAISAEELCTGCPGLPADQYEPDNFPGTGTAVNCGVTQTHTIPVDGDVDWFAITLQPGDDLVAETFNLSGANPDTVMELYDAGCNLLLGDDDSGSEAFASRIQWTAAFAGVYFIKVRTFGGVLDECNDQGGGPKSCQYDINFDCGSCCNPPFLAGDRVRLNVDDPGGAADLPAGTCGTVACCASSDPAEPIL